MLMTVALGNKKGLTVADQPLLPKKRILVALGIKVSDISLNPSFRCKQYIKYRVSYITRIDIR